MGRDTWAFGHPEPGAIRGVALAVNRLRSHAASYGRTPLLLEDYLRGLVVRVWDLTPLRHRTDTTGAVPCTRAGA